MGKKKGGGEENLKPNEHEEGHNLLGSPTFKQLENGRFKCVETGHELPAHARDSYADSKHCRLGLIDSALSRNKPPLNMFQQDPISRSKLICRLTGYNINKSEEHIWKHINGKRFLNILEKKEAEKETPKGATMKLDETAENGALNKKKKKEKKNKTKMVTTDVEEELDEIINKVRDSAEKSSDSEIEADFWMPPTGERWDHDDGGDRWGSDSESDDAGVEGAAAEEAMHEAGELSKQAKRMSLQIGPSSFASRKKKRKTSVDDV